MAQRSPPKPARSSSSTTSTASTRNSKASSVSVRRTDRGMAGGVFGAIYPGPARNCVSCRIPFARLSRQAQFFGVVLPVAHAAVVEMHEVSLRIEADAAAAHTEGELAQLAGRESR